MKPGPRRRLLLATSLLIGWWALAAAGDRGTPATAPIDRQSPTDIALREIPGDTLTLYRSAAAAECPGLPWAVLAAIGRVETIHHQYVRESRHGALGPMQFLPSTWAHYGVDADGDGQADVHDPEDATHGAARYLCRWGGADPARLADAVWQYNHADWYVDEVLATARRYGPVPATS